MARAFETKPARSSPSSATERSDPQTRGVPPAADFTQLANRLHVGAPIQRRAAQGPERDFSGITGPGRPAVPGGLPAGLRADVEARSGLSMDDVRVHRHSDKPARIGALAYAQGRDIHLGPGQERHLPHEAWHVVQQKQGRVRPTLQMRGLAINDDSALEREADGMATGRLPPRVDDRNTAFQGTGSAPLQPSTAQIQYPIQRKIGFEFETSYVFEHWKGNRWAAVGRTKDDPFYEKDGFKVEGDTHNNCEFITKPFAQKDQVLATVRAAAELTSRINARFEDGYAEMDVSDGWKKRTRIHDGRDDWAADVQVTQGVRLENLPHYIADHMTMEESEVHQASMKAASLTDESSAQVRGLVEMLIKFVTDFQSWDGANADEGPKNAQAWMARTKYIAMVNALDQREQFRNLFFSDYKWKSENPITRATGLAGSDLIVPNKYLDVNEKKISDGTTLEQWLKKLCFGSSTDQMSPPSGWGGNYGMGLMPMDTHSADAPLALLEYRKTDNRDEYGEMSGKSVTAPEWDAYAEEQFDKAKAWNATLTNGA